MKYSQNNPVAHQTVLILFGADASVSSHNLSTLLQRQFQPTSTFKHLEKYVTDASWNRVLAAEFERRYFTKLKNFLTQEFEHDKVILPVKDQIFASLNLCSFNNLKVVIIGLEPLNYSDGLAFSVQPGVPPPSSLKNIYKELVSDIQGLSTPNTGSLKKWAEQGVLLLNKTLTLEQGRPNSHAKQGWEQFTQAIVELIVSKKKNVVFMLWGTMAQGFKKIITEDHLILEASHPSPLSVSRFTGCKHFSKCNEYLRNNRIEEINWQI
jgi:uracil-DNA glycosylase